LLREGIIVRIRGKEMLRKQVGEDLDKVGRLLMRMDMAEVGRLLMRWEAVDEDGEG
jgi:hypothetical protein